MGKFIKGEVVTLPFPFSNLSGSKRRPALVISDTIGNDIILCQITASRTDSYTVELKHSDFATGSLTQDPSFIRPNKLFTADIAVIASSVGKIKPEKYLHIVEKIVTIIS